MENLKQILESHKTWFNTNGESGKKADLPGADLHGAILSEAILYGANLPLADLRMADLHGADFSGADLDGANLSGADLDGANLRGVNLHEADLHGVNLHEADLHGAYLHGAKGIIRVGPSQDGYEFFGVVRKGETWIKAGCRWFTVLDAKTHWTETRKGTKLGEERLFFVSVIEQWGMMQGGGE